MLPLAFLFDSAGPGEWLVLGVVILTVVGPKRLPAVARKMGKMMETLRRAADEFKSQVMTMDQDQHPDEPPSPTPYDVSNPDGIPPPDSDPQDPEPASHSESPQPDSSSAPDSSSQSAPQSSSSQPSSSQPAANPVPGAASAAPTPAPTPPPETHS